MSQYLLEIDKAQAHLETSNENLEKQSAQLENRKLEIDEEVKKHIEEKSVCNENIKHVMSEHSNAIIGLKTDFAKSSSLLQQQHRESEQELRGLIHIHLEEAREKQAIQADLIKKLLLEQYIERKAMYTHYDSILKEIKQNADHQFFTMMVEEVWKLQDPIDSLHKTQMRQVNSLIERQKNQIDDLEMTQTQREFEVMQEKKMRIKKLKARLCFEERKLNQELAEKTSLQEKLSKLEKNWDKLQRMSEMCGSYKDSFLAYKRQKEEVMSEHRDLTVQQELLRAAIQEAEEERDALQRKEKETILDLEQRISLKRTLQERKFAVLAETLKKEQAELDAALSGRDPETPSKLKELMEVKDKRIAELQEEITQKSAEYNKILHDIKESWNDSGKLLRPELKPPVQVSSGRKSPQRKPCPKTRASKCAPSTRTAQAAAQQPSLLFVPFKFFPSLVMMMSSETSQSVPRLKQSS
nr:PREDICTED: growth arrest-specific protein 8-like [Austrofundulus limnaeus]